VLLLPLLFLLLVLLLPLLAGTVAWPLAAELVPVVVTTNGSADSIC
jgi:hypothetical protein